MALNSSLLRKPVTFSRALKADIDAGTSSTGALIEFLANKVVAQHLAGADKEFFPLFAKAAVA